MNEATRRKVSALSQEAIVCLHIDYFRSIGNIGPTCSTCADKPGIINCIAATLVELIDAVESATDQSVEFVRLHLAKG